MKDDRRSKEKFEAELIEGASIASLSPSPFLVRGDRVKISSLTGIGVPRRYKERVLIGSHMEIGEVGVRVACQEVLP